MATEAHGERIGYPSKRDMLEWGIDMQRDDELIRKLMLEMEAAPEPIHDYTRLLDDPAEIDMRTYYHLRLLADAGLVEEMGRFGGMFRMTNDGHDFVGYMKDDKLWNQMRKRAGQAVSNYGVRLLFEVGNGLVKEKLREMGLPI